MTSKLYTIEGNPDVAPLYETPEMRVKVLIYDAIYDAKRFHAGRKVRAIAKRGKQIITVIADTEQAARASVALIMEQYYQPDEKGWDINVTPA